MIITPAKDEEKYIEGTIRSVIQQTILPAEWVIVDDGSKDSTQAIIQQYLSMHPFIRLVCKPNTGIRQPGSAVIRAFQCGNKFLMARDYDFIVKLDCDLSFEQDYFENLLGMFMDCLLYTSPSPRD